MGTINKVDYVAAYRQFATYGNGRSLKQFCTDENLDYSRLGRYATKSFLESTNESTQLSIAIRIIDSFESGFPGKPIGRKSRIPVHEGIHTDK